MTDREASIGRLRGHWRVLSMSLTNIDGHNDGRVLTTEHIDRRNSVIAYIIFISSVIGWNGTAEISIPRFLRNDSVGDRGWFFNNFVHRNRPELRKLKSKDYFRNDKKLNGVTTKYVGRHYVQLSKIEKYAKTTRFHTLRT